MKLDIEYASFFNRNIIAFINKSVIDKYNNVIYRKSGIYTITNKINGYRYIEKSKNVAIRLSQHKSLLRNNHHVYRNGELSLLQKAWNKYGEDAFDFKIVEFCEIEKLNEKEQYWITYYKCNHSKYRQGYNVTDGGEGAYSNQNVKGRIQINNGEIQKMIYPDEFPMYKDQGFIKGILPQNIEKCNQNKKMQSGENHWAYGKQMSEETKRKMSFSHIGKSTEWLKGKPLSNEHKKKLSKVHKGRKMPESTQKRILEAKQKAVIQFSKNNDRLAEYISAVEAENKTGVRRSHISQCCNGKRKSAGGYVWRFKNE